MVYSHQLTFQNSISTSGYNLEFLHDYVMILVFLIMTLVLGILLVLCKSGFVFTTLMEWGLLEFAWTLFPVSILLAIGFPSFSALYLQESEGNEDLDVKVTGHQWYWTYDYTNFSGLVFDSYMKPLDALTSGEFRLLDTDNHLVLPVDAKVRFMITSSDVLHSWAMPSLGSKVDANPGRLNTLVLCPKMLGLYFGQCSEICGTNHSFMPIVLESTLFSLYKGWVKTMLD